MAVISLGAQAVSGKFQLSIPLLAAQASIFRKLFCDFSPRIFTSWCG